MALLAFMALDLVMLGLVMLGLVALADMPGAEVLAIRDVLPVGGERHALSALLRVDVPALRVVVDLLAVIGVVERPAVDPQSAAEREAGHTTARWEVVAVTGPD